MLMGSPEVQGHTLKLTPSGVSPKGEHTLTGTSPTTLGYSVLCPGISKGSYQIDEIMPYNPIEMIKPFSSNFFMQLKQ